MWILWTDGGRIGGWGVGGCTTPVFPLFAGFSGQKRPPVSMLKNPPFSTYDGLQNQPQRQLERLFYLSFNDNSPQLIHTLIHIIHIILSFFNNSNILFDIHPYHIWYTVSISRTYRHICTLYADVIINAYGYGGNGQFAISKKVLPNVCSWRYTIATRWGNGEQPEPTALT